MRSSFKFKGEFCGYADCGEFVSEGELTPEGKRNNVNLLVGIGAEFHWGGINIPISVRLNEGIGTYSMRAKPKSGDGFSLTDLKTQTLQIVTGITF